MKQDPRSGQGGPAQVKITAGTEDDLAAIVGILNYTAANSIASFERPVHQLGVDAARLPPRSAGLTVAR
jgi:hypothetical protein